MYMERMSPVRKFGCIYLIGLHHLLVLGGRNIRGMGHDTVDAVLLEGVVCGKTTEA